MSPQKAASRCGPVLVIDDDDGVRNVTVRILGRAGYKAIGAADGIAGEDLAKATPPACALVDLSMPGLTGMQVHARLRALQPALPIVLMSGNQERPRGIDAGTHFLAKPYHAGDLLDLIARVTAGRGGAPAS